MELGPEAEIAAEFTRPPKPAGARHRLRLMEAAIMFENPSSGQRPEGSGSITPASTEIEQSLRSWRNGGFLDKEDLILVLLLLASVAVCLLTVVGVVWG